VICKFCGYLAQVKATKLGTDGQLPPRILGAAWGAQQEQITAGIYHALFIVGFAADEKALVRIDYVPARGDTPDIGINTVTGENLITWDGRYSSGRPTGIKVRRLGLDGTPQGDELTVDGTAGSEVAPSGAAIAFNPLTDVSSGEFLLVWSDRYGVQAQRRTVTGTGYSAFRVVSLPDIGPNYYSDRQPAVAYNTARREYLVAWVGPDGIRARRLSPIGSYAGTGEIFVSDDRSGPALVNNLHVGAYLGAWSANGSVRARGIYTP